jgi:membrane protein
MKHGFVNKVSLIYQNIRYYIKGIYNLFNEENIFFLSSGIAFNGILCLIPLLLLITSLIGIFINSSILPIQKIDDLLSAAIPSQPYAQQIKTSLKGVVRDIIQYRSKFGIYGIAILIWTSASMFSSIRHVLIKIYQIKTTKLVVIKIIENIVLVIILGLLFFVANLFSWILFFFDSILKDIPGFDLLNLSKFVKLISSIVSYVPALVMFFIINRFIPDKGINNRVAMVSALTTTTLWWIAGKGFGWYLTAFHPYSKLYGTYAFLLVFLLWVYYSSIVFIVGVMVGQLYREKIIPRDMIE